MTKRERISINCNENNLYSQNYPHTDECIQLLRSSSNEGSGENLLYASYFI